jgi:hypothetical protein
MITLFAIPKPFVGHIGVIQRNAVQSWTRLRPACEVLLIGNDPGVAEAAAEWGVRHIRDVARNAYGTPLLDSAFRLAAENAHRSLLCYINADIMLTSDFLRAAELRGSGRFLMVGQRWDVDLKTAWDFSGEDWEKRLLCYVREQGRLHPPAGSDYFLFPAGDALGQLPSFAVGRPGWDNWFLQNARRQGVPLVDATAVTTVIHQNHDYRHVPEGKGNAYDGPEGQRNFELAGSMPLLYTVEDATHRLTSHGIRPIWTLRRFLRFCRRTYLEQRTRLVPALLLILAGRVKHLFVPYPEGYRPLPLREQIAQLFGRRKTDGSSDIDKN